MAENALIGLLMGVLLKADCRQRFDSEHCRLLLYGKKVKDKIDKPRAFGDGEKEFNVNAIGLERVFISRGEKTHTTNEIMQDLEIMQSLCLT